MAQTNQILTGRVAIITGAGSGISNWGHIHRRYTHFYLFHRTPIFHAVCPRSLLPYYSQEHGKSITPWSQ